MPSADIHVRYTTLTCNMELQCLIAVLLEIPMRHPKRQEMGKTDCGKGEDSFHWLR